MDFILFLDCGKNTFIERDCCIDDDFWNEPWLYEDAFMKDDSTGEEKQVYGPFCKECQPKVYIKVEHFIFQNLEN